MKKNVLLALSVCAVFSFSALAKSQEDKKVFITVDADSVAFTTKKFGSRVEEIQTNENISVLKIDESALPWLSLFMHKEFKRCGGFMLHEDESEALTHLY
jgi:leucyl aminopeptidase